MLCQIWKFKTVKLLLELKHSETINNEVSTLNVKYKHLETMGTYI